MRHLATVSDQLLRGGLGSDSRPGLGWLIQRSLGFICVCGLAYGAVMGSFGGWSGARAWQLLYSATKIPLLLLGTFVLCLPSFFVLNTIAGLRSDFWITLRTLLATQAAMTLILCSFAPLTAFWYLSNGNYRGAVLFNGLVFLIASLASQILLRRLYRPLVQRNPRHLYLRRIWLGSYIFVGIQLGWLLRPFVGEPSSRVELFREQAWGNAYVEILHHLSGFLSR